MNNFEMAILALGVSLSMGAQAADSADDNIRIDRNTIPNDGGAIIMPDCSGKVRSDRTLCDKELGNDRATDRSNANSRLNRNRDINNRNDINSNNSNMQSNGDGQALDNRSGNMKRNDINRNGTQTNDANTDSSTSGSKPNAPINNNNNSSRFNNRNGIDNGSSVPFDSELNRPGSNRSGTGSSSNAKTM